MSSAQGVSEPPRTVIHTQLWNYLRKNNFDILEFCMPNPQYLSPVRHQRLVGCCAYVAAVSCTEMRFRISSRKINDDSSPYYFDLIDFYDHAYMMCPTKEDRLRIKRDVMGDSGIKAPIVLAFITLIGLKATSICDTPRPRNKRAQFDSRSKRYKMGSFREMRSEEVIQEVKSRPIIANLIPYKSLRHLKTGYYSGPTQSEIDGKGSIEIGHSVLVVGHTKIKINGREVDCLIIQNSWGNTFGLLGYAIIPLDCVDIFTGFWVLENPENLDPPKRHNEGSSGGPTNVESSAGTYQDEIEEITWQTYKGQLTEKQEKTRDKVVKRLEKIAHMKKEINAIRVKDISQGGLTQGQQTQIARNEQRISQIMEELENLEETLNDSIRESMGARAGRLSRGKRKGVTEDEEEDYFSDDDDFYDRTQKSSKHKISEDQSVETADTLLDKKDGIVKRMEDKRKLLLGKDKATQTNAVVEAGDALDAYMSAVSYQLVLDNEEKIRKELSTLQSELDRILYLLKIADPTGEAARRREFNAQKPKAIVNHIPDSDNNGSLLAEASSVQTIQDKVVDSASKSGEKQEEPESVPDKAETSAPAYTVTKPQWLGAVVDRKKQEIVQEVPVDSQEKDQFVDYKDRGTMLIKSDPSQVETTIEDASPGLIIRKRKHVEISQANEVKDSVPSVDSKLQAEDAVALLLKHSRGYHALDEEEKPASEDLLKNQRTKDAKKPQRVLGPERPSFLDDESDSTWVPPEGQSGDGRTFLNDRLGY